MSGFIMSYDGLIEIYDDQIFDSLENISYSKDSFGNRVEVCRCTKFLKQDPEFIVFKVETRDGDHLYVFPGSIDLVKDVYPMAIIGDPVIRDFDKKDAFDYSKRLGDLM